MAFTILNPGIDSSKRKRKPSWMKNRGQKKNICGGHFGLCKFLTKLKIWCGGHAATLCQPKRTWCIELSSTTQSMIGVNRSQNLHSMLYGPVENWMWLGRMTCSVDFKELLSWLITTQQDLELFLTLAWLIWTQRNQVRLNKPGSDQVASSSSWNDEDQLRWGYTQRSKNARSWCGDPRRQRHGFGVNVQAITTAVLGFGGGGNGCFNCTIVCILVGFSSGYHGV